MKKLKTIILGLGLAITVVGCAFDEDCDTPGGECIFVDPDPNSEPNNTNSRNATNSANSDPNSANSANSNPNSVNSNPNSVNSINSVNNAVCPRPSTCGPEPDEEFPVDVRGEAYGCIGPFEDEFSSRTVAVEDSVCEGDRDWHGVPYSGCDGRSFVIEAVLTPDPGCESRVELKFGTSDKFVGCDFDGAECTTFADGTQRARIIIPAQRDGGHIYFVVDSTGPLDAPYTIRVRAYQ